MISRKTKLKYNNILVIFLIIFFLSTLSISAYYIIKWNLDSHKTNEQITKMQQNIQVNEVDNNDNIEIIDPINDNKTNPYWDYIKMNLITVNFNDLKTINDQTKAWIQVNGTNINYPVVQTNDNKYYLTHSFDKSYNSAGWVFLDYRNILDGTDKNIIIYAHGRFDQTMFGSLKNILNNDWLNNTNNYIVKLSTEHENTLWQVFSIYCIPTTSDYIRTSFSNNTQFKEFTDILINRSIYNFNTTVSKDDRILTISTCYDNFHKVVLHAKLIKQEIR